MSRHPTETREKVLRAACELIAANGRQGATMQMICARAGANIAAANYYFRSKDLLYEAVWERASAEAAAAHDLSVRPGATAEERLRACLAGRLRSIMDDGPGGWLPRILFHACAEDPGGNEKLFRKYMLPRLQGMEAAVRELLGPLATELQVRCCVFNIHSLYVQMNVSRRRGLGLFGPDGMQAGDFEAVLAQIQNFAVGGIKHLRRLIETEGNTVRKPRHGTTPRRLKK